MTSRTPKQGGVERFVLLFFVLCVVLLFSFGYFVPFAFVLLFFWPRGRLVVGWLLYRLILELVRRV
jgi:hypothetical protein